MQRDLDLTLGALPNTGGGYHFKVWAPFVEELQLELQTKTKIENISMHKNDQGYFSTVVKTAAPGDYYRYCFDGKKLADPASRFQPMGVFGPSQLTDVSFAWTDQNWHGLAKDEYIIYELHVGTYTEEGTFEAIIPHLQKLKQLGISAIEVMPVAQFSGERNWGYDGVFPFAVQNSYGGPESFKKFINACHNQKIAVILDVVYNHIGPEGNYFKDFGPYFTDQYKSPWGEAINFDGAYTDHVRRFFIENALYWIKEYHVDALRLDALHAIFDRSAYPFLRELADYVHDLNSARQKFYLIAESDLNDTRLILPVSKGGFNLDCQWSDDFHHALHSLLVKENYGYYQDFGELAHFVKAYEEGYIFSGQYSKFRKRIHGISSKGVAANKFVVFSQNHDQVGNRIKADRLATTLDFHRLKLAASIVLLSGNIPLLFMGEEYGEIAPFHYFISHQDQKLIQNVREGRKREFQDFNGSELIDPQSEEIFKASKLNHRLKEQEPHNTLLRYYQRLIQIRLISGIYNHLNKANIKLTANDENKSMIVVRQEENRQGLLLFHFKAESVNINLTSAFSGKKILDSHDAEWGGKGSLLPESIEEKQQLSLSLPPFAFIFYQKED